MAVAWMPRKSVLAVGIVAGGLVMSAGACLASPPPDSGGASSSASPASSVNSPGSETSSVGSSGGETSSSPSSMSPSSETSSSGSASSSEPGGGSVSTDPTGPDFTLFTLPECSIVPNGALSGLDALSIFVALRNSGPGVWSQLVPWRMVSDTGLSARGNTAISTGSSFTAMQVDLNTGDYGRSHRFTITADPDNTIVERDETNNELVVTVNLGGRPTTSGNVACTSP
jgi:CARDB